MSKPGRLLTFVVVLTAFTACSSSSKKAVENENTQAGPTCDQDAAKGLMTLMSDPRMGKVTEQDGRVIVRFGTDYTKLTPLQRQTLTGNFIRADSCLHKQMRVIEFQSPTGEVVAETNGKTPLQM